MENIHVVVGAGMWKQDGLRYRRHRLADFLASQPETHQVFWVCPSPSQASDTRVGTSGTIEQWAIKDLLPQKWFRFGRYVQLFHKQKLESFVRRIQPLSRQYHFYLWYTFPGFPVLSEMFHWDKVIYDCSDLWAAPISGRMSLAGKTRRQLILNAEKHIVNRADQIFCTSDFLHLQTDLKLPAEKRNRVLTFENGVDYDLFATNEHIPADFSDYAGKTVLGYIGGIKPKLDFSLIDAVARKKPDWQILLVGPDGTNGDPTFARLLERNNVKWVGGVSPKEVPQYMRLITIGMMPYKSSPYNDAVFPLKLFEFLAAGISVVGVHLPSTKKYEEASVYTCLDSGDPEQLIRVFEQMEHGNDNQTAVGRRKALAQSKDWPTIFTQMMEAL